MKTKPAAALAAMLVLSAAASVFAAPPPSLPRACTGKAVATDGHRLLALVVGVGKYRSKELPALAGSRYAQARMEVPVKLGWLPEPLSEGQLHPTPMFL